MSFSPRHKLVAAVRDLNEIIVNCEVQGASASTTEDFTEDPERTHPGLTEQKETNLDTRWTLWRSNKTNVSLTDSLESILAQDFVTAPRIMSRAQSPSRPNDLSVTVDLICEKLIKLAQKIECMEAKIEGRPVPVQTTSQNLYPRLPEEDLTAAAYIDKIERYDKCLPMIPEFDGNNAEQFINMILRVKTILVQHQHQFLLLAILSQKLKGRAATAIRADTVSSLEKLIEKVKFLYGKTIDASALTTKRNMCKQRNNETLDEFIERFSKIHDEIITAINVSNTNDTALNETREILATDESIRAFKRNVRRETSLFLFGQKTTTLQETFELARMFDLETQYGRMFEEKRPFNKREQTNIKRNYRDKNCGYCKKIGHLEEECRTKKWHQEQRQKEPRKDFTKDNRTNNPPGASTMQHQDPQQEHPMKINESDPLYD